MHARERAAVQYRRRGGCPGHSLEPCHAVVSYNMPAAYTLCAVHSAATPNTLACNPWQPTLDAVAIGTYRASSLSLIAAASQGYRQGGGVNHLLLMAGAPRCRRPQKSASHAYLQGCPSRQAPAARPSWPRLTTLSGSPGPAAMTAGPRTLISGGGSPLTTQHQRAKWVAAHAPHPALPPTLPPAAAPRPIRPQLSGSHRPIGPSHVPAHLVKMAADHEVSQSLGTGNLSPPTGG